MSATLCCRGSARSATVDESRPILASSAHTLGAVRPLYEQVYTCFSLSLVSAMAPSRGTNGRNRTGSGLTGGKQNDGHGKRRDSTSSPDLHSLNETSSPTGPLY
jgi:hypothetical protein